MLQDWLCCSGLPWRRARCTPKGLGRSGRSRCVVPYAAGGYTDLIARLTARYMEKALGKPVVVDSRPGAGGIVGTQAVASAAPDGYTFCVCSVGAISVAPFAQKVGYDPVKDLAPVSIISTIVQAVIVKKALPVTIDGRARRLCQGQSRQAQLRLQRRRRPDALFGRAVPGPHRHVDGAYSVQGRRAGHGRGALRRRRPLVRQHDRRPAADRGRHRARPRGDLARAQPLLPQSALDP